LEILTLKEVKSIIDIDSSSCEKGGKNDQEFKAGKVEAPAAILLALLDRNELQPYEDAYKLFHGHID